MPEPTRCRPPVFANPDDATRFRDALRAAGYSTSGILRAVGLASIHELATLRQTQLAARVTGGSPIATLIRLFLLAQPVEAAALERAVAPLSITSLVDAGLVEPRGFVVVPVVGIAPYEDLVIAHDVQSPTGNHGADFVMGAAITTILVARNAVRPRAARMLDLGTGSGVLSLLASRHCERVVGCDINERAIQFARLNAVLNGITNCEFRRGSWFEPVEGETFDLIHANPPFVITSGEGEMYFSGGKAGDAVTELVARGAAARLGEGGHASIMCNWAHLRGQDWRERLKGWFEGQGVDALVLPYKSLTPTDYAVAWVDETVHGTPDQKNAELNRWLNAYQRLGIEAITYGFLMLRRNTTRPNWFAVEEIPENTSQPAGDHVLDMLDGRDFLWSLGPGAEGEAGLLAARVAPSPHLRIEELQRFGPAGWKAERTQLQLARGYAMPRAFDQKQAAFLRALTPEGTVGRAIEHAAAAAKVPANVLAPVCVKLCRQMIERAMFVPVR